MAEQLITPPEEVRYIDESGVSRRLDVDGPNTEGDQTMLEGLHDYRQQLREKMIGLLGENDESDMDIAAADAFVAELGLADTQHQVVGPDFAAAANWRMHRRGYAEEGSLGTYIAEADLAVIYRDARLEELNGPGFTESYLVHEKLHGSAKPRQLESRVQDEGTRVAALRLGQMALVQGEKRGAFIEEGFCDAGRAKFIIEKLKKPTGFVEAPEAIEQYLMPNGDTLPMRTVLKYYAEKEDGTVDAAYNSPAVAGSAMMSLIENDPGLWDALIRARTETDGLREVARRIDAVKPGLYMQLSALKDNMDDFTKGSRLVADALAEYSESAQVSSQQIGLAA